MPSAPLPSPPADEVLVVCLEVPPSATAEGPGERGAELLIVDDDRDIRRALEDIAGALFGPGAVACARDGAEALELLKGGLRPRRLLTDLRMPRLSGEELVAAVRTGAFGEVAVITMTASVGATHPPGAEVHLTKPFTIDRLRRALLATAAPSGARAAAPRSARHVPPAS